MIEFLDTLTEKYFFEAMFSLAKNRSTLWITHLLTGMENMDEILVIDRGKIVERGIHDELLDTGVLHSNMWDLQNQTL